MKHYYDSDETFTENVTRSVVLNLFSLKVALHIFLNLDCNSVGMSTCAELLCSNLGYS